MLIDRLPDEFSRLVLEGSLRVVRDDGNPIRMNLFAAGIRELFGHILHSFAADEEVRACSWFVQSADTPTVTRRQRAVYATQGGFSDDYVAALGVDVEHLHEEALKSVNNLHKATHVRPERLEMDPVAIDAFVENALAAIDGLLDSFQECRDAVRHALDGSVYNAIMIEMVTNTFETIDILSGKGYEVGPFLEEEDIEIESISSTKVFVKFSGVAPVTLHYGSKDDAAEISHDFPFWMRFSAPVNNPTNLSLEEYFFDDSDWFE